MEGRHPAPYCIIVDFADFKGFSVKKENKEIAATKVFPFPLKPTWVPIYKQKFNIHANNIPT